MKERQQQAEEPRTFVDRIGDTIDAVVMAISPKRGARRIATRRAFRAARAAERRLQGGGFDGADERDRGADWLASRLSPNSSLELDQESLRAHSRELVRNDSIGGAIDTRVNHVVGLGFTPQCRVTEWNSPKASISASEAKEIKFALEQLYRMWAPRASIDRRRSLWQITRLVERTVATDGEAFVVFSDIGDADTPVPLALEVVSCDRVETPPQHLANPRVRMGIERDPKGRIVAYWIRRSEPNDTLEHDFTYDRVPAERVCHVFEPWFPAQSRGLPWLTRSLTRNRKIEDLEEYTLMAAEVEACYVAFIETPQDPSQIAGATTRNGRRVRDLEPGTMRYLRPGEKMSFAAPHRPSSTYEPFVQLNLRRISAAIDMAYEMLAKDWRGISFAGGRLILAGERLAIQSRQRLDIEMFLTPTWNRLVTEAVILGETPIDPRRYQAAPWLFQSHVWTPPAWQYAITPGEEVEANARRIETCQSTLAEVLAQDGKDLEETLDQLALEKRMLEERGLTIAPSTKAQQQPNEPTGEDRNGDREGEEEQEDALVAG